MNKLEYLRTLESALQARLSQQEVNEIMRDYAEYFAEGARQGKSDDEIAANLGDPIGVAQQVITETQEARQQAQPAQAPKETNVLVKVLLIVLGICLLPFAVCLLGGALFVAAMAVVCLFGAVAFCGCGVLFGLAGLAVSLMYIGVLPATAVVLGVVACVALIAGGVLGLCLSLMVIRLIWKGLCWCGRKLYTAVTKKPYPKKAIAQPAAPQSFEARPAEPQPFIPQPFEEQSIEPQPFEEQPVEQPQQEEADCHD